MASVRAISMALAFTAAAFAAWIVARAVAMRPESTAVEGTQVPASDALQAQPADSRSRAAARGETETAAKPAETVARQDVDEFPFAGKVAYLQRYHLGPLSPDGLEQQALQLRESAAAAERRNAELLERDAAAGAAGRLRILLRARGIAVKRAAVEALVSGSYVVVPPEVKVPAGAEDGCFLTNTVDGNRARLVLMILAGPDSELASLRRAIAATDAEIHRAEVVGWNSLPAVERHRRWQEHEDAVRQLKAGMRSFSREEYAELERRLRSRRIDDITIDPKTFLAR